MRASEDQRPPAIRVVEVHESPFVRGVFLVAGIIAFAIGVIGIFLPLLPTAPLIVLAAACFARAYRPFHEWLLAHRWFGPMLREWYHHRSVRYRTKVLAIAMMLVSFTGTIVFIVRPIWAKVLVAIFALAVAVLIYRLPSRDAPQKNGGA
jgi:uncharacterized membrane protein YbaN (DUF454 family)